MRAFVAIEIPEETRQAMASLQRQLREAGVTASWVKPENFHLTLRFLGDIDEAQTAALTDHLHRACAACGPVHLCFSGAGAFPNVRRPSVIWAGLHTLAGDLAALQRNVEQAVRGIGLPPEPKSFHPHVTVARVRDARRAGPCEEGLTACASLRADAFEVRHVALFSSRLHTGGSGYARLETFSMEKVDGR